MSIPVFKSLTKAQRYINSIPDGESRIITIKGMAAILDNIRVNNETKFIPDAELASAEERGL